MTDRLCNTQHIFIASKNVSSDAANVTVQIPEDSLRCKSDEYLKLTLSQFSMVNSLYNVYRGNNTVTIAGGKYVIEPGFYRISEIVTEFNLLWSFIQAEYLSRSNKIRFTNTTGDTLTIGFQGSLSFLFGTASITIPANGSVTANDQVIPRFVNDIVFKLTGVVSGPPQNIDNLSGGDLNISQVLGIAPLRAAPGLLSVYTNVNDTFTVQIYDQDVQQLSFQLCDITGNPVQDCPPWTAVVKCDVYKRIGLDPLADRLSALVEYARLSFISNNLQKVVQ